MHEVIEQVLDKLDDSRFEIETYGTCVECGYDDAFATFEQADRWYLWTRCDGCGRDDNVEIDMDAIENFDDEDIREVLMLEPNEQIVVI